LPTYDYRCEAGHRYEKRESFGAPAQQPCERCEKPAQRVLTAPTVVFKGTGWYKTDNRGRSKSASDADSDGASESKSATKTEAKSESSSSKSSGSSKNGASSSKNGSASSKSSSD
jgi:putative FmdB family regulatory protein